MNTSLTPINGFVLAFFISAGWHLAQTLIGWL